MANWISVEERRPEAGENVLVYFSGKEYDLPHIDISFMLHDRKFSLEGLYGKVTHWMPLPEPPENVGGNEGQ